MKKFRSLYLNVCTFQFMLGSFFCDGQNVTKKAGICKELAIDAAQIADQSYTFSTAAYFSTSRVFLEKEIDSAIYFIRQSVIAIDSAILLAPESNILALEYATQSKNYAAAADKILKRCKQSVSVKTKKELLSKAVSLTQNAVVEAYHSSFYFIDATPKVKKTEPVKDTVPKQITKLDVDQALFTLLSEQLSEKTAQNKKQLAKLSEEEKTTKDPAKLAKIKTEVKKLELQENEIGKKDKDAKEKLSQINTQIDARDKNQIPVREEETVFSKTIARPPDEWNKQVLPDSSMPMKLIYLIQIGVYKNEIMPEIFKGITPIFSKIVPGGVSYSTGLFEKLDDAKQAKAYLKSIGLNDAFIVPYYKQKKISLEEAQKLEKK